MADRPHYMIIPGINMTMVKQKIEAEKVPGMFEEVTIVRCKDCEYSYVEGFVHERLKCEKHPELEELKDDWFCADCWQA